VQEEELEIDEHESEEEEDLIAELERKKEEVLFLFSELD
jgi:hypothetical protein